LGLLFGKYVSTRGYITCLDFLFRESVLGIAHAMEVRAVGIVASHILDKGRTILRRAVRGTNVAAF